MSDHLQVECPKDGKQYVVELGTSPQGERKVAWCSREFRCPGCDQGCLSKLNKVAYLMLTELPHFKKAELRTLSIDRAAERFESCPAERLPVLDEGTLIGCVSLRKLALWNDTREATAGLNLKNWRTTGTKPPLLDCLQEADALLKPNDSFDKAVKCLLTTHQNEAFVIDDEGRFCGLIYARQLLRASTS